MKKISFLGVLVGGVVDVVATNILVFPLVLFVLVTKVDFLNLSQQEATNAVTKAIYSNWMLFTIQLMLGSFCSIFGGYLAAIIAGHDEPLNGALSAYLCIILGIYSLTQGTESILLGVLGFILGPALGYLGGHLRLLQVRSKRLRGSPAQAV